MESIEYLQAEREWRLKNSKANFLKDFAGWFQWQLPNKIALCIVNICKWIRIICIITNYMSFLGELFWLPENKL